MIARLIRWSVANRFLVMLATLMLTAWGIWAVRSTPVDALPDLSDVQVIIRTSYPGQAPQIVENQVTYPLATTMLSVPGAKTVRGFSFFGDSFVYVLFDDGTDLYWARSRVLEYLNQVQGRLPASARPALGPDATGVGWIFQYALVDRTGKNDLAQLRALQDWFLKFELKSLPNVAEVASVGGMVKQYQVVLDPLKLAAYGLNQGQVREALLGANQESGGSVLELSGAEYMVRAGGYLKTLDDFRAIPLIARGNVPVRLGDIATVQVGPEMRRGIAELDGEGEVAGGVVVLRSGKNAQETIAAVKAKLAELQGSLPQGVEIVTTYDRSALIERAIHNLTSKLIEEFLVVAVVCAIFLWHLRSALVAIIALPLGVMTAFLVMRYQGINANIMSLGGIAIAVGAMVDAAVVMIENAHKKLEAWQHGHPGQVLQGKERWDVITQAAEEVGPALFFSLLIITLSFVPVFTLEAQEGRLFGPLAFTKTYAMAAAAGLSVTLIPVLMGYWIRGRIPDERKNPITRALIAVYRPCLEWVLRWPKATMLIALATLATTLWPLARLGGEFLPQLDEGDLLYMPSALPGLSAQRATELLQISNRMIKTVPEVERVFGKAGRAETATDPAPLEMFETTVKLKPREQWRPGMTPERLIEELDSAVKIPGLSNIWIPPIRNRIDMLATGIKSPIGVKVSGSDLRVIDRIAAQVEQVAKGVPGVSSALAERLTGGRYIDVEIDRLAAGRYGLNVSDIQAIVSGAIGGENVSETVEGLARFPISLRYPREWRDSPEKLVQLPIATPMGQQITLGTVASIAITDGPPMLKSENARPSGWVYVDVRGRDLASVAKDLRAAVTSQIKLEPGVSLAYSGQFEYLERANARLKLVVPATLLVIFVMLYLTFSRLDEALLIMATLPFALTGGIWFLYLLGYNLSIATGVGFIALAGVAAEFGVVMLIYLKHALAERCPEGAMPTAAQLLDAIREGAVLRVRPKAMTVAVILA
ncbi:efflux RND transporter permease subunit, partial [Paucibacter sp. O1-1]|nr:efflux RND transporter permease subunit [Paucibacter sp. O1-1]MDA3824741.1 efflux RND transporter permease subunit [Paucibacter sp. O1-1]